MSTQLSFSGLTWNWTFSNLICYVWYLHILHYYLDRLKCWVVKDKTEKDRILQCWYFFSLMTVFGTESITWCLKVAKGQQLQIWYFFAFNDWFWGRMHHLMFKSSNKTTYDNNIPICIGFFFSNRKRFNTFSVPPYHFSYRHVQFVRNNIGWCNILENVRAIYTRRHWKIRTSQNLCKAGKQE